MANRRGKSASADAAKLLIAGVQKSLASGQSTFGGGSFTAAQIVEKLQLIVDLRAAVTAAQATTDAKVDAEDTQLPGLLGFMSALEQFVRVTFVGQADVLAGFGLEPRKATTPLTVEQKAAATAKNKATRAARGTKGTKAKLGIRGAVIGVEVNPIVAGPSVVVTSSASAATVATAATAAPAAPAATPITGTR